MFNIFEKYRHFIVEEADVVTVLAGINNQTRHKFMRDITVANCGWAEEPTKWFITFNATDTLYGKIVRALNETGKFKLDVRPGGQVDICYERGH